MLYFYVGRSITRPPNLRCVLMLNWITWNRTVLTLKLCTYAKVNCLKWNCFCTLNWIAWNLNCVLMLNWIDWNRTVLTLKLCTYAKMELFEMELFWHLAVCKQKKTILMLNWNVWTVYVLKWIWHWITYNGWCAIKPNLNSQHKLGIFNQSLSGLDSKFSFS